MIMNNQGEHMEKIEISKIRTDGGTQPREQLNHEVIGEYAEALKYGAKFPKIVVYYDGEDYWLADGFHRYHAYKQSNFLHIECDVRQGTRRDAVLFSVGVNSDHGLRRTNADKRRAVLTLLRDEEWAKWSDREIARQTKTSPPFVSKLRETKTENVYSDNRIYTTKHGTESSMDTKKIGGNVPQKTNIINNTGPGGNDKYLDKVTNKLKYLINHSHNDLIVGSDLFQILDWMQKEMPDKAQPYFYRAMKAKNKEIVSEIKENNGKKNGNMYEFIHETYNPITGTCPFDCIYCYVKQWSKGNYDKRKQQRPLRLDAKLVNKNLGRGNYIFVGSGTDMFCDEVPDEWIEKVLEQCSAYPENIYLFQSKNPERFLHFMGDYPLNTEFCTTLETNEYPLSDITNAPSIEQRVDAMRVLGKTKYKTMITIEPILKFELTDFVELVKQCNPDQVNIGADSKGNDLPEPNGDEILELIEELEKFTTVHTKNNLNKKLAA
jgi:DNA repair photolyase